MANYILCTILFRLVLPVIILTCVVFRPCLISGLYLLLLLLSASFPVPTNQTFNGSTGIFMKIFIFVTTITATAQVVFHTLLLLKLVLVADNMASCTFLERVFRHAGFVRLDHVEVTTVVLWALPEIIMFLASIIFYTMFSRFTRATAGLEAEEGFTDSRNDLDDVQVIKENFKLLSNIGKILVIIMLCIAAVLVPSVLGGFYFFIFLSCSTWLACYRTLDKGFAVVLKLCMIVVCGHLFSIYAYQTQWVQEYMAAAEENPYIRYFGLTNFMTVDCVEARTFIYHTRLWTDYANIICLLILYFILAIESDHLLGPREVNVLNDGQGGIAPPGESTPLLHGLRQLSGSQRLMRASDSAMSQGAHILQDSTGSVTIPVVESTDEIPMVDKMKSIAPSEDEEEEKSSIFERIFYALESILLFIIKTSYIGTNIIMMAWSITYHSWLTFILLLWASILWMVPNQRKFMLRSSPFLVLYAWFLLISAYAYSMDLTEDELPTRINDVDLTQIGFVRNRDTPCQTLLVKCLYTLMFWITLRQYVKERKEKRQESALIDIVAPLHVSVGAVGAVGAGVENLLVGDNQKYKKKVYPESVISEQSIYLTMNDNNKSTTGPPKESQTQQSSEKESELMKTVGTFVMRLLTKFWIWIVAITLFIVAITGERMTVFRILYMALFLVFILSFQVSFNAWRKLMFGFWLTVIVYSMIILVLVYTYQFNNFKEYWRDYLHVSDRQQLDIGLEKYETKQLFVRLVTPTFFVIIAVIQLHYFHRDFMTMSDPVATIADTTKSEANSSAQGGLKNVEDDDDDEPRPPQIFHVNSLDLTDIENLSAKMVRRRFELLVEALYNAFNLCLLYLEIHMSKLVLFMGMFVAVMDVCTISLLTVILMVMGATIGKVVPKATILINSFLASLMLLSRMLYQIEYVDHSMWNTNCSEPNNMSSTVNDAKWLGFDKILYGRQLPKLVKWNIVYIVIVTVWCIIDIRQRNFRVNRGRDPERPFIMFPKVKITNSSKNLKYYLMYLANYMFYRLGLEICLIAIVATIGLRMDMYALFYAIFLCVFLTMDRSSVARFWNVLLFFIATVIPIQYIMVVGLPPSLCLSYPWDENDILRKFQEWAFLLDPVSPPPAKKILCDFALLILVSRQALVFRIEKRYAGKDYPGGNNDSIIHKAEATDFVNPNPDFVTYSRTYLDVFKRATLLPFMWVTLAIIFLAATYRVNIFSLGYLIGSFYFLWEGSDIYLRPIPDIIKKWNYLIAYNVMIITAKVIIQLIGCIFIDYIKNDACWLIHLFSISCLRKFKLTGQAVEMQMSPSIDECIVPREYIGLAWDGASFACLILLRRIFQSYDFFHIVNESKASTILESRGAELIEELRQKRMEEQEESERKVIEKIKTKMDRIKANQQKILGPNYTNPESHYVDPPPLARSPSMTSCRSGTSATSQQTTTPAGYHTPIDDDDDHDVDDDEDVIDEPPPLTPATSSAVQANNNSPSPYSAIMTGSLDAYLEPQRISFSSPPNSELTPRRPPSPDDSFPVFSPPPYDDAPPYADVVSEETTVVQRHPTASWMNGGPDGAGGGGGVGGGGSFVTPRQSVISYSTRSPLSHHTYTIFPKSSRPKYQRKDPKTYKEGKSIAIRSGDYYMFEDIENEELDMFEDVEEQTTDEEEREEAKRSNRRTVTELLASTMKTDVGTTIRQSRGFPARRRVSLPPERAAHEGSESQISMPHSAPPTVRIMEPAFEPQPSTSLKPDEDTSTRSKKSVKRKQRFQKFVDLLLFVYDFIGSSLFSASRYLNRFSHDHRYVIKVLTREKKTLKETTDYNIGSRPPPSSIWQPSGSYKTLLVQSRKSEMSIGSEKEKIDGSGVDIASKTSPLPYSAEQIRYMNIPEIRILAPSMERGLDSPTDSGSNQLEHMSSGEMSSYDQPILYQLLLSIWYLVLSHSDLLCYFIIFLNQVKNATFISLPLPLMVFFWGTLTVPRPSKTFWVTIIAYTQIIVIIKCFFQFKILSLSDDEEDEGFPFNAVNLLGFERKKNFALWDLLLLLVVYFHRFMLKRLGLWKSSHLPTQILPDGYYNIRQGELKAVHDKSPSSMTTQQGLVLYGHEDNKPSKPIKYQTPVYYYFRRVRKKHTGPFINYSYILVKAKQGVQSRTKATGRESDLEQLVPADEELIYLETSEIETKTLFPAAIQIIITKYLESVRVFFHQLFDPTSRVAADVYSYMFLCDFFNFFVILIGYSSFGSQQGDVSSYLEDNRVPVLFLLMLIIQFLIIIVDRAIFLRKNIFAKIIFQFLQILMLHIWLFILFPIITERNVNSVIPPQMYYMVKCFYLLLSAYQIRCGYPTRILGNFLCKGYNYLNMFLFKGFMLIPFLFELRTVMDWMWTDTSMTVFDWIKMEDIFAHIFQLKCTRYIESEYPQPRGERKNPTIKYLMGGGLLALIVGIIWFPLVFFSLGNAVGEPNPPYDVTIDLKIGPYEALYRMSAQSNSIFQFSENDYQVLTQRYTRHKGALSFISNYEYGDIAAVKLSVDSATVWSISPPDVQRMITEIESDQPIMVHLQYQVSHKSNTKEDPGVMRNDISMKLEPTINNETNPIRESLLKMLRNTNKSSKPILLKYLVPKFIKVTSRGTTNVIKQLMEGNPDTKAQSLRNINLNVASKDDQIWWEMKEECNDYNYMTYLRHLPYADCEYFMMYTFNDKIFPATLNIITGGGIIGLYTTLVFVASRVLRGFFSEICFKIMFDDMPYVDRMLQLTLDIYLVREAGEFSLEEDLFAKLVFLYRSPETLIKWTRPPEEMDDDEEDPENEGN